MKQPSNQSEKGITKTDNYLSTTNTDVKVFSPEVSKIIELSLGAKIYSLDTVETEISILDIISKTHQLAGQTATREDLEFMAETLNNKVREIYPECTIEEIKQSAENGVYGKYGDFFGLNARSYFGFLSDYLKSGEREIAIQKFRAEALKKKDEPKQLTIGDYKKLVMSDYKLYQEGNHKLILFDEKRYMLLVKYLIPEENEIDWQGWLLKGRNYIEHTKTEKAKKTNDKSLLNQVALFAESFDKGEVTEKDFNAVQTAARKLRYFAYFDHCIKNNITDIFNQ